MRTLFVIQKKFIKIVGYSHTLFELLFNLSKAIENSPTLLSTDHTFHECLLIEEFRNHRQIKVFGDRVKANEVKYNIVLNWWFYLQSHFPCLLEMLTRVRYKIDSN
jgi:hypothetical protein